MLNGLIYVVLGFVLLMLVIMTYYLGSLKKDDQPAGSPDKHKESLLQSQGFLYTSIILIVVMALIFTWYLVRNTPWKHTCRNGSISW